MFTIDIELLVRSVSMLAHQRQFVLDEILAGRKPGVPEEDVAIEYMELSNHLRDCGLTVTAEAVDDIIRSIVHGEGMGAMPTLVHVFNKTIIYEFKSKAVFTLPGYQAKFNRPPQKVFGDDVCDSFPSALADLEEACKCLAFARSTAGVFHLMRATEAGLKSAAKLLGIPYAPSWEAYITQLNTKITAKHKTKTVRWKRDEPYFKELLGDFQAIKLAWRNPTMHIVRRYTQEEAEDVLVAVRAFMQRLATRCKETK